MIEKVYDSISDEELEALTNAIKGRYGVDFTNYEKKSLKRGFSRLMGKNKIQSLIQLWNAILRNPEFFKSCIDDLTVNLTELFRNPEIWDALDKNILPIYRSNSSIDIWHAGCSTGEEVYSMAMVIDKLGLSNKTKLLGTDISSNALRKAKEGRYAKMLVDKYEKSFKKYLRTGRINDLFDLDEEGNGTIRSKYLRNITFKPQNLVVDQPPGTFDIVFCRNVMIYFDDRLKFEVFDKLLKSLKPGGVIILGYYDMLPESCKQLVTEVDTSNRIYKPQQLASALVA